MIRNLDCSSK